MPEWGTTMQVCKPPLSVVAPLARLTNSRYSPSA